MPRIAVDISALRESRDLRLLIAGNLVSGLGTQAALVALPFQIYEQTHSALLTGLLGAVELVPLVTMALLGGAIADRFDRRARAAARPDRRSSPAPPRWPRWRSPASRRCRRSTSLGGLLAGFGAVQNVTRTAIVPNLVAPARLRSALALNFGLFQLTLVIGPALGGLLIGASGSARVHGRRRQLPGDGRPRVVAMAPQPPPATAAPRAGARARSPRACASCAGNQALVGSFAIDLMAMTFGMPRALFPVLAVSVYHAGAEGTGLLYAAVVGRARRSPR